MGKALPIYMETLKVEVVGMVVRIFVQDQGLDLLNRVGVSAAAIIPMQVLNTAT
jgi:hypothetical protein